MEAVPVLPLWSFHTDIVRRNPGALDTAAGHPDQGYGHPTLYVTACVVVGIFPFCHYFSGYVFNRSLRLHDKEAVPRYYKRVEVTEFS